MYNIIICPPLFFVKVFFCFCIITRLLFYFYGVNCCALLLYVLFFFIDVFCYFYVVFLLISFFFCFNCFVMDKEQAKGLNDAERKELNELLKKYVGNKRIYVLDHSTGELFDVTDKPIGESNDQDKS